MTTKRRKQAPQWFMLRNEVLASIGRMDSSRADRLTYNVMVKATKVLMSGQALPDGLKATFLENIRRRTKQADFVYLNPVQLTGNQRKHAKKTGQDVVRTFDELWSEQSISTKPNRRLDEVTDEVNVDEAVLLEALQLWFKYQSTINQPDFRRLSSIMDPKLLDQLTLWWCNQMKSNKINHGPGMISASHDMRLAGSPERGRDLMKSHEPAAPEHDDRAMIETGPRTADANPAPGDAPPEEPDVEITISYFQRDPRKSPSANLEIGSKRYALVFSKPDVVEDKILKASDVDWWKHVDEHILSSLRAQSRVADQKAEVQKFVLSPFYDGKDTFGRADIAPTGNIMAILRWTATAEPEAVEIVIDFQSMVIPLQPYRGKNPRGPQYKGHKLI